jgi:hypothetical protein
MTTSSYSPPRSLSSNSQQSTSAPSVTESALSSTLPLSTYSAQTPYSEISDISSSSKPRRAIQKRNRSAAREDLKFVQIQEDGSNEVAKIRVWVNDKNMAFYDCSCEKRKPVQDLNKIKLHVMGHLIKRYTCSICSREFANYRQLNGHLRIHQTNRRKPEQTFQQNIPVQATPVQVQPTFAMGPPPPPATVSTGQIIIMEAPHTLSHQHHQPAATPVIYYQQ